jgi:hypothetical protein
MKKKRETRQFEGTGQIVCGAVCGTIAVWPYATAWTPSKRVLQARAPAADATSRNKAARLRPLQQVPYEAAAATGIRTLWSPQTPRASVVQLLHSDPKAPAAAATAAAQRLPRPTAAAFC